MNERKIPIRRCVGCGVSYPETELLRIVRLPDGKIEADPDGRKLGRGAYLCKNQGCLRKAVKSKRFEKSLSAQIGSEVYEWLENEIGEN